MGLCELTRSILISIVLGSLTTQCAADWPAAPEGFQRYKELQKDVYRMWWGRVGDNLTVEVQVKTTGWVGLGFSPNGGMAGADIILGWVKDGKAYVEDRHAVGESQPIMDNQQDVMLLKGEEVEGYTVLSFTRPLRTCDTDDMAINDDTSRVIYAYSPDDPDPSTGPGQHAATSRGVVSILLLQKENPVPKTAPGSTFNLTMDNFALPSEPRTHYICRWIRAPPLGKKHHVTQVAPLITPGHELNVHHILVWPCTGNTTEETTSQRCQQNDLKCSESVYFAWAVGGVDFVYPEVAGVSIGGPDDPTFFQMQIHYDNPGKTKDIVDSSGLTLHYTDKFRQYDAGIVVFGNSIVHSEPLVVPPKARAFDLKAYCSSQCTQQNIPQGGITAFATVPHTHNIGMAINLKHIRNGTELSEIVRDDHYDFDLQAWRLMDEPKTLLPGDEFITTCTYTTREKNKTTYGGPGSDDEMCLTFVLYYPRQPWISCVSTVQSPYTIYQFLDVKAQQGLIAPVNIMNPFESMDGLVWKEEEVDTFQDITETVAFYKEYCVDESNPAGLFGYGPYTLQKSVKVQTPYRHPDPCQPDTTTEEPTTKAARTPPKGTSGAIGWGLSVCVLVWSLVMTTTQC